MQHSQESLRPLAKRHGINPKTVAKWKKRDKVAPCGSRPSMRRSVRPHSATAMQRYCCQVDEGYCQPDKLGIAA